MATQPSGVYKEGNFASSRSTNHSVSSIWDEDKSTSKMPPTSTQPPPSTSVPPPPAPTSLRQVPPPLLNKPPSSTPSNGVVETKNGGYSAPDNKWNVDEKETIKRQIHELKRTFHNGRYLIVRHLPKDTTEQVCNYCPCSFNALVPK